MQETHLFKPKKSLPGPNKIFTLLTLATIIVLVYQLFSIKKAEAAPLYSCGSLSANHCYGRAFWPGATDGASTDIFTNGLTGGDGFVDDEMWIDSSDARYWVEGGFIADVEYDSSQDLSFWADSRPGGGFHFHPVYYLSSEDYGKYAYVIITRDSPGASTWDVTVGGIVSGFSDEQSTVQTFAPAAIKIGTELAGSNGAKAPRNGYTYNQWFSYHNGNTWHYQGSAGSDYDPGSIVNHYWVANPSSSSPGGQFSTCFNSNC